VKQIRLGNASPQRELLALLVDCQILFKVDAARDVRRAAEDDDHLALWDFHDLLFHARSSEGRHANPTGGVYPHVGVISPLPAVRPRWPGKKIDLHKFSAANPEKVTPVAKLLRERHSTRRFDDQRPIILAELSRLLEGSVRVLSKWKSEVHVGDHVGDAGPVVEYAIRPYPSAGASYELELYLAVDKCGGLDRGFYHYDAGGHALVPIKIRAHDLEAMLTGARLAMGEPAAPQVLITIAARFGRMSWKYSSIAYALILKDVGVLTQTLYMLATDMGLGGCAVGSVNIDLFAKMTGIEFHIEGPVGQFAIGRGATSAAFGGQPT
jgi:SagB-type dehydrogenase family enzyme